MTSKLIKIYLLKAVLVMLPFGPLAFHANAQPVSKTGSPVKVEVIYFHAPNRCPSCIATEKNTKQFLEKHFKNEMTEGHVSFQSLDLKAKANEVLVEKYEIVFPTLLILKKQDGKEMKTDYSTIAFQYAYADPARYESLLKAEINKNLK
jgi:hypothetical protein